MNHQRRFYLKRSLKERLRQFDLPGTEFDVNHGPNDWIAIISRYLAREAARGRAVPSRADFEDALVKAAAVILAALEHCESMEHRGRLTPSPKSESTE